MVKVSGIQGFIKKTELRWRKNCFVLIRQPTSFIAFTFFLKMTQKWIAKTGRICCDPIKG